MADDKKKAAVKDIQEPEVVAAVQEEIKKLGENTKSNYDELRAKYEEFKSLLDSTKGEVDGLVKEQIAKLTTDITTRQQALDDDKAKQEKDFNTRMDTLEVAVRRLPKGGADGEEDPKVVQRETKEFFQTVMSKDEAGATMERMALAEEKGEISSEVYKAYRKVFNKYLRQQGDERNLDPQSYKDLSVGIDPDGGYTVVPEMSNRIITRLYETDPVRQLANVETISTGAFETLVDWGDAGAEWETETVASADRTTPTWNKKRIPVHPLGTRPKATQTLLEDSTINIEAWLAGKVSNRFGRTEAAAFVTGTGAGQPRGFLTYPNGTAYGQIQQVSSGVLGALQADGFIDCKYALKEFFLGMGTWLMNRLTVSETMQLKDGAGNYLWKPGFSKDDQATLLGLPVRMSTTMPIIANNSLSYALADWREAYTIVDRIGITVQRDPYTAKPLVEFYFRKRVGADVMNFEAIKLGVLSP
jgi:HK97 family phage major capsid protein